MKIKVDTIPYGNTYKNQIFHLQNKKKIREENF